MKKSKPQSVVKFDEERGYEVFSALEKAWKAKEGIFNNVVLPEARFENLPTDLDERANFLFLASITMRGGSVSDDPARSLDRLSRICPEIFNPAKFRLGGLWNEEHITELFSSVTAQVLSEKGLPTGRGQMGPKYREFARSWVKNAGIIYSNWGGSILNVFAGVKNFEEAFSRIDYSVVGRDDGFAGMRRKIFSLFAIWLQTYGVLPIFPTPLPVDFHALRIVTGTKTAEVELRSLTPKARPGMEVWAGQNVFRVSEKITDEIALWSQEFMLMNGFDHLAINPAIWVLSRTLCADHFQNSCLDRVVPKAPLPEDFKIHHWPKGYRDPCQFCPIRKLCHQVAPSGPYYRWGFVIPIKRVHCLLPKQDFFPGLEQGFTGRMKSKKDV